MAIPTPDGLRDTLVEILVGVAGGTAERWRSCIGEVEYLPLAANVRSNWRVEPTGTAEELATIARAVEIVRDAEPYVVR